MVRRRAVWVLLVDLLPAALGVWMVFHVLRGEVASHYRIESRSMEPTLHGARPGGDVVLVDKTAFWSWRARPLARFDLVVVRNRHKRSAPHLVKRFIAAGPAEIAVREGDLYVRDGELRALERVVKDPLDPAGLRQTVFALDFAAPDAAERTAERLVGSERLAPGALVMRAQSRDALLGHLTAAALAERKAGAAGPERVLPPGFLATKSDLDSGFLDAEGEIVAAARAAVRDVGLELDLVATAGVTGVLLVVEVLEVYHAIEWTADGRLTVTVMGTEVGPARTVAPLPVGTEVRLAFGYLDGRLFVTSGDAVIACFEHDVPFQSPRELLPGERWERPRVNVLHVAATGSGELRLERLRAFHDIHYQPRSETWRLEPGEIFVLGDNSFDSADSRDHAHDPFRTEDLIGRPVAVMAPGVRRRWL